MGELKVDLTGKVAIVTGAGGGLGRAFSKALAESGARVVATDYDGSTAESTAKALSGGGSEVRPFKADVTKPDERA